MKINMLFFMFALLMCKSSRTQNTAENRASLKDIVKTWSQRYKNGMYYDVEVEEVRSHGRDVTAADGGDHSGRKRMTPADMRKAENRAWFRDIVKKWSQNYYGVEVDEVSQGRDATAADGGDHSGRKKMTADDMEKAGERIIKDFFGIIEFLELQNAKGLS